MIPHNKPTIGPEESQAVADVIASGWIAKGAKVAEFEQAFAEYVGAKYAIAVNSGTAALTVALYALETKKAILPTYCCAAVINAVNDMGAIPELWDINKDDFNIERPRITNCIDNIWNIIDATAIIPHTFGVPCDYIDVYKSMGMEVIEDCSQALGSYINGQHVGLQGDIGIFSFGPSKMITTGSGGMIVTNSKDLADKARDFIDYDKNIPAFNFAMNDIAASMGLVQLKKLPEFLRKRRKMANAYTDMCIWKAWNFNHGIKVQNNWYRFVLIGDFVGRLKQHLVDNGITAIVPITQDELLHNMLGMDKTRFPNAEWVSTHSLSLPIYPSLSNKEFNHILDCLRSF